MSAEGPELDATPSHVVVDASVAIKWFIAEPHADAARRLLDLSEPVLHVPDLFYTEIGNVLWKKVRRGEIPEARGCEILALFAASTLEVHPSAPLLESAFEVACRTGRTVYDSLYVTLAIQLNAALVTADEKLVNALRPGPLARFVNWIGDLPGPGAELG